MGKIQYDGMVDVATGRSRRETHWRNGEMLWSALLARLSQTHRTAETVTQYAAEKRDRQVEIKDVGGFVGGYVNGGRRKAGNIMHRGLLTLDIDYALGGEWECFALLYNNAGAIYSTHKHTPQSERLRLVVPLDRAVGTDEYMAIARRVAQSIGIDCFDDTTYAPERLMYWPSTPSDGEYRFEYQDGPWLSADDILATYKDWKDSSSWPVSSRVGEVIRREITRQGDPLGKPGVIGAFCRAYDVHQAIEEFLADVYEPCDIDGRYTFKEGSTAGGLVVYDDIYTYSHHSTDPTSGRLCNAFDLVRLHRFAQADDNVKESTPINKTPSFLAMSDLAASDGAVKRIINRERAESLREDFADGFVDSEDPTEIAAPADMDWADGLDNDRNSVLRGTIANYEIILRGDPNIKGVLRYNEFKNVMEVQGRLPWRKKGDCAQWKDTDDAALRSYIERHYRTMNRSNLSDALANVYEENRYHPVKEYLQGMVWDGVPRLERLFVEYLGAPDDDYTRAVTRKALVAAVARVFAPGTKFDNVVVLVGAQGVGKSTILKKLGGPWFSDNFHAVQGKDAIEQIQGVWIMEIGELAGLKKAEVEAIKSYISTIEDRCRLAYARRVESFPRQCIFFGTTNNSSFLNDPTGNRRFWPIEVSGAATAAKNLFTELDKSEIGQIWAEAVTLYKAGEKLFLGAELERYAYGVQTQHSERDERLGAVQEYLDIPLPENWAKLKDYERRSYLEDELSAKDGVQRERVCVAEIWTEYFRGNIKDLDRRTSMEIHNIMRKMEGWVESKNPTYIPGYGRQRIYRRGTQNP